MGVITRSLIHRARAMLFALIVLVAAGVEATSPRRYQPSKCPSPAERDAIAPLLCGPNSHFERCSKVCPPQTCSALIDPYWLCESNCCKPECRCNDGYYKDDQTGLCISRDECLAQCGPFERFVKDCPECQRTCANYKVTGPRSLCKPFTGCVCQEGRVRLNDDATGPCVPTKECPLRQCLIHEHWEDCPSVCARESCISRNPDYKCLLPAIPLPCKPRCICDKGYLRNHLGHCIRENHCPIKRCPINEVWRCASMCARDSCKRLEPGFKCPLGVTSVCIPACACKDGYLRNDKGLCVPREKCPASPCGINEVAVECKAYPPLTCESVYTLYKPIAKPPCVPGCDCRPGYLRNKHNICVPSEFCPTVPHGQCGPRQEYKECGSSCEPSCSDLDNPPRVCPAVCVKGCFCKDGYRKDEHGNCVTRSECPLPVCNKPNEVAKDCGSYCEMKTCEDYNRTDIGCPAVCVRGCFCRKGYVRNAYGVCIRPEKCPPKPVCLQENEEYQLCGSSCPDNCLNYMNPDRICTMNCVSGCNCKKGYVRNLQDNTCIKPEQCPTKKCVGTNEELNLCASYCPVTCANRFIQGDWSCITLCREACDCVSGTLRNDNGTCVPVDQCSPPVCRQNEKYMNCGTACPLTCDNYKTPPPCTRQCVEDCFCEDGYVRDRYNRCVKPENCEPICPAGEKFNECSAHCQDTCENYNVTNRFCTYQCQSGCVCEQGTVRRKDGKCVPPNECSAPTCPADEVYDPCSAHCEPTCEHNEPNRPCTDICTPGCRCGDGLVRRSDGKCVKVDQCPPPCPPSEHYDECNSHCEETCELHGSNVTCLPYCNPGCRCNDGLVRRKDGQCVNLEHCSALHCSADEEYDPCSAHCEPTCESYGKNTVCAAYCEPGCRCKKGLVRRKDKQCVKPEECQNNPQCGVNERWVNCVLGLCIPLSCDQLGFPIACPGIVGPCEGGCVCAENYVRDGNNVCIPQQDCPSCGNDFNATVGCGVNCGRLCTNYQNPPNCAIPQFCNFNGCDCKEGYVYDTVTERCVAPVDCPIPCNGDLYAEKVKCPNPCPPTCAQPTTKVCAKFCLSEGCQCRLNFVRNANGKCVKPEDCPVGIGCNGDPNAHISSCVSLCQPTCGVGPIFCPALCRLGCACNTGYMLSKPDGICIKPEECVNVTTTTTEASCDTSTPASYETTRGADGYTTATATASDQQCTTTASNPQCGVNERWVDCVLGLCIPLSCDQLGFPIACPRIAGPCEGGCVCAENYVRDGNNVCIPQQDCPSCGNDFNATVGCGVNCGRLCTNYQNPPNCAIPQFCNFNGCDCKEGYVYDTVTERCVAPVDCPIPCNGDLYAEKVKCPNPCPPTCAQPTTKVCAKFCLSEGCQCRLNFVRNANGKCVKPEDCPVGIGCNGDPNAHISSCVSLCQPTCGVGPIFCPALCRLGCACNTGYMLSKPGGICIKPEECVNVTTTTTEASCDTSTPPYETTRGADGYTTATATASDQQSTTTASSTLILCPQNEIWINCKAGYCKPQYCRDMNANLACPMVAYPCPGGCICRDGLLRNEEGVCIPKEQCPISKPCSDPNAIRKKCASHESCRATCAVPNSRVCPKICIIDGCECKQGYVLSERGGKCVRIEDCPRGNVSCNGDPNAVIEAFPPPCPSTCDMPNGIPGCLKLGLDVGCSCKPGYILSAGNGKCILPDQCKCGNPCGANATFSSCRVNCPYDYCPVDDSRAIIACDPPYPTCPTGCVCKLNYKRKSEKDDRCIVSSTCPPVKCTRPNEVWDSCPSECRRESCADVNNQPTTCNTLVLNCQPQCICKKGYFRNGTDICIPAKDCPNNQPCDDPNAERLECAPAPSCRSTCARPNPSPCILSCAVNECVCKKGFVLSAKGGNCIPVDQCPKDAPCNGDTNAVIKANPIPCPSTCSAPNASPWCKRYAPPVGCECKPGYLQAEDGGKCIKPDECPGGNPCGANGTFVWCRVQCPNNYCPVNDNRGLIACDPPRPCPSGCICKLNYKRRSTSDDTCILSSTCPPVKCTRPNEVWNPCITSCYFDNCRYIKQIILCKPSLLNCQPQCVCKKGHYRNDQDICVPESECPINKPCEDPNAARLACAPAPSCRSTCTTPNPSPCIESCAVNECVCKKGFVLSENGKCIAFDQCPKDAPCNGDSNAVIKVDPIPCPSTCSAPNASPFCKRYAPPVGCECKPGYLQAEDGGKCIKPDECPGGNPCGVNGTFVLCSANCPTDNCPVSDSRAVIACSISNPCPNGCACKLNYRRKSNEDNRYTCILASDCPPVNCTRPNEIWSPCPSACLRERCSDVNNQPTTCNTLVLNCQPQCICKKGYFRDDNDICIPSEQCPAPDCPKGEVYSKCGSSCPPSCENKGNTCMVCTAQCVPGCYCAGKTIRAQDGTCVLPEKCPAPKCTGPNEEFDGCPPTCPRTQNCSNLWSKIPCTPIDCCKPQCRCKSGFFRNDKNICVSGRECSNPTLECGPNEVSTDCYNDCQKTCKNRITGPEKLCTEDCGQTGCICKPDYLRHDNGTCVPVDQCCPPDCPKGEVYSDCGSSCPPSCENKGNTCLVCTAQCVPGCYCAGKTIRAQDGTCVLPEKCPAPKCTGPNEEFDECPPTCPRTQNCSNLWSKITCTPIDCCKPQCRCKSGFFRNDKNICVSSRECSNPTLECGPNEVSTDCYNDCQKTCKNRITGPKKLCTEECGRTGCICKPDYLRHDNGTCVPVDQCCPPDCPKGEVYSDCGSSCPPSCKNKGNTCLVCTAQCVPGCYCAGKTIRAEDGTCVLPDNCPAPKCTGPNEIFDKCPPTCPRTEKCSNLWSKEPCTEIDCCKPQCRCKPGFYRNDNNVCISAQECTNNQSCDDPNAERLECAPHPSCRSTCAKPNPSPCILSCAINQCVCKKGFVLSENGKCITVDQCPKDAPCNGDSNAVIKANPIPCPSTCSYPNANPWCERPSPPVGCECKPGYLLAQGGGKCIKPDECPGGNPCGVNATFVWCSVNCPTNNCPVSDTRAIVACSPPFPCPNGCSCKLNYKRRSSTDNTCILASDCPPVKCTRPNEMWSPCPSACLSESCADVDNQPTACNTLIATQCQPRCICKKGHFRNDSDICVPARECPNKQQCSDPNAERVKCAPAAQCRPTCADQNPGPCTKICVVDDCVCKKGFILSEKNGTCIPEDQCPAQCSDPNAERVRCGLNPECRASCAKPNPLPCISQICIDNACVCKQGFVLSEKGGKCVAPEECPIQKSCNGDPNAQIKVCPLPCPATCDAPNAIPCRKACVSIGCECKDGYILSEFNGKCILPEKCKGGNPCGRNETFVPCKVPCPSDYCPVGNSPNRIICETPNPCLPGCVCKINYRRRSKDDQRCMYASECPPQKCNKNEVWSGCPSDCLQEDCSNMNDPPVVCNTLLLNCQPKCICKKGYYRDSNRNCVPAKQCPKPIQCKANEVYRTCRAICPPQTCDSIYSSYDCRNATQCEPGCDCLPEYLRNGTDKDPCIPSNLCPINGGPSTPECGINEHYETDGTKCDLTCKNYDLGAQIGPCKPRCGCFCDDGHVRNSNGVCIPENRCPKPIQCKANEVYKKCRIICPPQTCASTYTDYDCRNATQCEPGCDCLPEYLRNGTDKDPCIPSNLCPINVGPSTPECGINEHYETDGTKCDLTCKNYDLGAQIGPCEPRCGCFCDDGHVRNSNGVCIPKKRCPKNIVCKKNEVLSECYNSCHKTCKTRIRGDGRMCSLACTDTGCLCVEGYLRHDNGTCVPISECSPPQCHSNETYSCCGSACPPTCQNRGDNCTACTDQCVEDCFCSKGYIRADDGTCVKPKDCPPRTCNDPNEYFDECPPTCPPTDGCSNIYSKFNCTNAIKCCKPQCRCKSGYYRNNKGICIPIEQCLGSGN